MAFKSQWRPKGNKMEIGDESCEEEDCDDVNERSGERVWQIVADENIEERAN